MCVFVSRPMNIVTFLRKNGETPKRVVDFPQERDTLRNKIMEIVEDFACESIFFQFFIFFIFSFSSIFHFPSLSFICLSFSVMFFHFLSFSFMFFHFLSFSIIFYHFLSFSFIFFVFVGCSKSDFFRAPISLRFLLTVLV